MNKTHWACICATALLALGSHAFAQTTNIYYPPATRLEGFETNVDTVVIRATALVGNVAINGGTLNVKCRDLTDTGASRRELGIAIDINAGNQREDTLSVDYDELDTLLNGIDYISRVDWSVTSFPVFDAVFTTRGGFRLVAFGGRRSGAIEYSVRSVRAGWPPLAISRDQLAQLRNLVEQAKAKLDAIKR